MYARLTQRDLRAPISRETHTALVKLGRYLLHRWGSQSPGRTWTIGPYVEGIDGIEFQLNILDELDALALPTLERAAAHAGLELFVSHQPLTPAHAWLSAAEGADRLPTH